MEEIYSVVATCLDFCIVYFISCDCMINSSSSYIIQRKCCQINTKGATSGAGTAHLSGAPDFTPGFQWGSYYSIVSFICMFCRSFLSFCTLSFGHCAVCSSDCPFGIFKLCLVCCESKNHMNAVRSKTLRMWPSCFWRRPYG